MYLLTCLSSVFTCLPRITRYERVPPATHTISQDTVPNKVDHLFRAQLFHDRKQREDRLNRSPAERSSLPVTDFLRPIVADADSGHGGITAIMKLVCTHAYLFTNLFSYHHLPVFSLTTCKSVCPSLHPTHGYPFNRLFNYHLQIHLPIFYT